MPEDPQLAEVSRDSGRDGCERLGALHAVSHPLSLLGFRVVVDPRFITLVALSMQAVYDCLLCFKSHVKRGKYDTRVAVI